MLPKDRLHVVALMLTSLAAMFQFIGILLPNWWILKDYYMNYTVTTFSLFGHIRCNDTVCYPDDISIVPVPPGRTPPTGLSGDNATWLMVGRIFGILGLVLVSVTVVLQLVFLMFNSRSLQVVADCFLITAGAISFITGFLFIGKFSTLSRVYVGDRPPGALTYTPAAPGCILFSSLLCIVAAVFTTLAFRPPRKDPRFL